MDSILALVQLQMTARGMAELDTNNINFEIQSAADVINNIREFTPTLPDLVENKYKTILVKMVIFCINKYGAEGEIQHSENGINRVYRTDGEYPLDLLNQIIPKVKVV